MSRLEKLFSQKKSGVLNVYCTAGYPRLDSTVEVMKALQENGADIIELGMPYSDPLADGPVIQASSAVALKNGMTISVLFEQLASFRSQVQVPVILMGYLNPLLQYGFERFCREAAAVGIDGLIIPDIPMAAFAKEYKGILEQYGLDFIFLVTPETSEERVRELDRLSSGFLYAVSSSSVTGSSTNMNGVTAYLQRLQSLGLKNPVLVGFGISDKQSFQQVAAHAQGAIIGSAYIRALGQGEDVNTATRTFLQGVLG